MANEQRMRPRKRKKVCAFCVDKVTSIDYKDTAKLRRSCPSVARSCPAVLPVPAQLTSAT